MTKIGQTDWNHNHLVQTGNWCKSLIHSYQKLHSKIRLTHNNGKIKTYLGYHMIQNSLSPNKILEYKEQSKQHRTKLT